MKQSRRLMIRSQQRLSCFLLVCGCLVLLAACAAPSVSPTPSPPPAITSTASATTVALPAPATSALSPTVQLPAPLLALAADGQIVRIEPDGATHTPLTHGPGRITGFDVSPTSGMLAYSLDNPAEEKQKLVYASSDGLQQTTLFSGSLRSPLFLADDETIRQLDPSSSGQQIVYHVFEPLRTVEPERAGPGLFVSLDIGMCPYLLLPDETGGQSYEPLALSPDGTLLLLQVNPSAPSLPPTRGTLALLHPDGTLAHLTRSDGAPLPCCDAAWGGDSSTISVADHDGVWRATPSAETQRWWLPLKMYRRGKQAPSPLPSRCPTGRSCSL